MLNHNPGGIDPSGRNFGGAYGPNQGQGGNNAYSLGGNYQGLHSVQQVQASLAGRPGYGGLPASSSHLQQGDRFQNVGPNQLHQLSQYGQGPNRAGLAHPGLGLGAGFSNNHARNQFGGQIGLPTHANIGNRGPSVIPNANMSLPGFANANMGGGSHQPPGLSGLQWGGSGNQAGTGIGIGSGIAGRGVGMRGLNSVNISGIDRGMAGLRVPGGVGGLLQHPGGINQQSNPPIPSQDLLGIMSRSTGRPGVPTGLFGLGQMQGNGMNQGQGSITGPHGNLFAQQQQQQQQQQPPQRAGGMVPEGLDGGGGGTGGLQQPGQGQGQSGQQQQRGGVPMSAGGEMASKPAFDVNDFPSLAGTIQRPGVQGLSQGQLSVSGAMEGHIASAETASGENPTNEHGRGFTMQKEDFPALPTNQQNVVDPANAQGQGPPRSAPPTANQPAIGRGALRVPPPPSASASEQTRPPSTVGQPYFQSSHNMPSSVHDSLKTIQQVQVQQRLAARNFVAGRKSPPMLSTTTDSQGSCDRFSLLGLLSVIRMIDEDLAMLALGQDLTTLGLKLDQAGSHLHKAFLSPWSNNQLPGQTPEFRVPKCYLLPPEKLRPEYLAKFKDETLFYIFYSCPGEEGQLLAGHELAHRGLVWHKDLKVWMMRLPNQGNFQKSPEGWERGSYVFFDTNEWKYQRRDNFVLKYEAIESNPTLPRPGAPGGGQIRQPPPPQPPPAVGGPGTNQIMVPAS